MASTSLTRSRPQATWWHWCSTLLTIAIFGDSQPPTLLPAPPCVSHKCVLTHCRWWVTYKRHLARLWSRYEWVIDEFMSASHAFTSKLQVSSFDPLLEPPEVSFDLLPVPPFVSFIFLTPPQLLQIRNVTHFWRLCVWVTEISWPGGRFYSHLLPSQWFLSAGIQINITIHQHQFALWIIWLIH